MHRRHRYIACLLVAASITPSHFLLAQVVELDIRAGRTVAQFSDATTMRTSGNVAFVVDGDRRNVVLVHLDSQTMEELPDGGNDAFGLEQPVDVDPTNGLSILVIDESGRTRRYDRNFVVLETLWPSGVARGWRGPFVIASVDERTVFILDIGNRQLLRWNRDRGIQPVSFAERGEFGDVELTDIAATSRVVYVADSASGCVLVFDAFGAYDRSMACDATDTLRSVGIGSTGIVVTRQSNDVAVVQIYSVQGDLEKEYRIVGALDAVAAALVSARSLVVLTKRSLLSFPLDTR